MSFFAELRRRNVFKVGIAYVVASWLLLQLTEVLTELLELTTDVGKIVIVLLIVGFVPALIFAWAFELTPEGLKKEKDVDRSQSITHKTGRKLDFFIIGVLALALIYFIWESRFEMGSEPVSQATTEQLAESVDEKRALTPLSVSPTDGNSIAVLPFANHSNLEDDSFFTDGIHNDLLTQLAKIRDLKVISRTSVMKYKNTEKTIPEIAEELQVATILEGGVQRAGKRIRINAQLIDVANDKHLWAETFDREMTVENIFDIQSEITRQIVQAVRGEMSEEERLKLARVPTNNLEAYEAYLQSLALTNRSDYSQENYIEAEYWAKKAVEADPEFAQAWAMLVEIHGQAIWIGYDTSKQRFDATAEALANAKRLGPDLAETTAAEAEYQYRIEQDFPAAVETFKAAHRALPGDVDILHRLAVAQRRTPDIEGAFDNFMLAMDIDPNHSRSPTTMAETLIETDDLDRAEALIDQWILRFPDARDLRASRVLVYLGRGNLDMARTLFENMTPWVGNAYVDLAIEIPFLERDLEQAIAVWDGPEVAILANNRGYTGLREAYRAWAHHLMGREEAARSEARKAIELINSAEPTGSYSDAFEIGALGLAYVLAGLPIEAVAAANRSVAMLPESKDIMFGSFASQTRAQVLGLAGKRDEALAEIERLLNNPYRFNRWSLYLDPRWDFFRDDERFNELIRPEGVEEDGP